MEKHQLFSLKKTEEKQLLLIMKLSLKENDFVFK